MNLSLEKNEFRNIFGTDLVIPQNIVFNAMTSLDYVAFRLPRGGGKDFLLSTYAMLYAASVAESHVSIVTPIYRQVRTLFVGIDHFSLKSTYFKDLYLEKPVISCDACRLRFKNGSILKSEAFDDSYNNGGIILVNEASSMPKQQLLKLIKGVENGTLKKVFLMSTGYYDYNPMNEIEAHEYFSTLAFGYKAFPTGFYDQAAMDEAKKTLSANVFDMEYNSKICKS